MSDELKEALDCLDLTSDTKAAIYVLVEASDEAFKETDKQIKDLENEIERLKEHRHYTDIHRDSGITTEPISI